MGSYFRKFTDIRFFLVLWSLLPLIHLGDTWSEPLVAILSLVCFLGAFFIKSEKIAALVSIVPVTVYLLWTWPFNANHLNFILISNIYLLCRFLGNKEWNLKEVLNFFMICLGVVYLWAAFHKLNWDYLNPVTSCSNYIFDRLLGRIGVKENTMRASLPMLSIGFEFLVGLSLIIYRTRKIAIVASLVFHLALVWSNFVNFASVPLVLFMLYVLRSAKEQESDYEDKLKELMVLYIQLQFAAFAIGALKLRVQGIHLSYFLSAGIWTGVAFAFARGYLSYEIQMFRPVFHKSFIPFIIFICFLGSQIYLGLGTSNSFSMFSNIRTEGYVQNHVLVPKELRIFGYQNDVYFVDSILRRYTRVIGVFPQAELGGVPLEYYRLYNQWLKTVSLPEPFLLRKEGDMESHKAIELLPPDPNPYNFLEMKFFHFRPVQYSGANRCRW